MKKLFLFAVLITVFTASNAQDQQPTALVKAAIALTRDRVVYDPSYFSMTYPMGDVPADKGVCTDVVIRAFRKTGIDLQELVHEDITANFDSYPRLWGLKRPDSNIDHRRVPNLMTFFSRHGTKLQTTKDPLNYKAGDIVSWLLPKGLTHIGIVIDKKSADGERPLIVHNIGNGQEISDCLFSFTVTGHYRYP
jgi:uncharacterized protein YijF (DUF1287 family)